MDLAARIAVLQDELAEARERVRLLETELGADELVPISLPLTPMQRRLLGVILKRPLATKSNLMVAVLGSRLSGDDTPDPKIVDVQVCHLRRKLGPLGISIETKWGEGYWMTAEAKALVHAMAAQEVLG